MKQRKVEFHLFSAERPKKGSVIGAADLSLNTHEKHQNASKHRLKTMLQIMSDFWWNEKSKDFTVQPIPISSLPLLLPGYTEEIINLSEP